MVTDTNILILSLLLSPLPAPTATQDAWFGVAEFNLFFLCNISQNNLTELVDQLKPELDQQIGEKLSWNETAVVANFDQDTGKVHSTFRIPSDPVNTAKKLRDLSKDSLLIKQQNLLPTYSIENSKYYHPVTPFLSVCELRVILSACPKGQRCEGEDGECRVITTTSPQVKQDEDFEPGVLGVLCLGGALMVILFLFLLVYCWRKGFSIQRTYKDMPIEKKKPTFLEDDLPNHVIRQAHNRYGR